MNPHSRYNSTKPSSYLLLIYPVILAAGSLFSLISPIASPPATPLAPGLTSDLHTPPTSSQTPNYFAGKHNIINIYFVKIGWLWTTLAFALLQATTNSSNSNKSIRYIQAIARYALVTSSWFFTTQWLFGPPLIDRSFTITGGHCEFPSGEVSLEGGIDITTLTSAISCKARGGRWRGGHDISGHIFMLTLSSAFLFYEMYISDRNSSHPSVSAAAAAKLAQDLTEDERKAMGGWETETDAKIRLWSTRFAWAVISLDFWMILMTAIWFHTWLEKLSGLVLATSCIWGIYYLPELVPSWGNIVGDL
jgi:hypothetical protein